MSCAKIVEKHEGPARLVLKTPTQQVNDDRRQYSDDSSSSSSDTDTDDEPDTARLTHNQVDQQQPQPVLLVETKVSIANMIVVLI